MLEGRSGRVPVHHAMSSRSTISRFTVLGAIAAALVLPAAAAAEYYVPPGNSAANQYTETLPSAGGDSAGKKEKVTPADAIGAANAKRLEQHGPAGKAAAELAAETAPAPVVNLETEDEEGGGAAGGGSGSGGSGGNGGSGAAGANGGSSGAAGGQAGQSSGGPSPVSAPAAAGSSGFGSVLGEATGFSDNGALGLWLPIAILAALAVALSYRFRILRNKPAA